MRMRAALFRSRLPGVLLALGLLASCAGGPGAGLQPNRFVTVGGETFGYVQLGGQRSPFPENRDDEFEPGVRMGMGLPRGISITILTREGRPVTPADEPAAYHAAVAVCESNHLWYLERVRGRPLQRGGILFSGACG